MRGFLGFFFKDGKATWYGRLIGMVGSILVMYAVIHFRLNNVFGWVLLVAAWIFLAVFGLSGRAEAIGLKPFTNDPLGWRKAKQSYKQEPSEQAEPAQSQDDQTPKRDEP